MPPSYSDLDPTCAHVEHEPPPAFVPCAPPRHRITPLEFTIGTLVGGAVGTFIVLVLLGVIR